MAARRMRYELRVGTHVGTATLATFRVPVRPTAVPRRTVYRFRVPADRDLAVALDRLIENDVQILEIRQCRPPSRQRDASPTPTAEPSPDVPGGTPAVDGVVVPFRRASGRRRDGDGSAS
jgi:hypothetical protein